MKQEYVNLVEQHQEDAQFLDELFFSKKGAMKAHKKEQGAKKLLKKSDVQHDFVKIFVSDPKLLERLRLIIRKVKDPKIKQKAAYVLYLLYMTHGKDGGFWRISSVKPEGKELINNSDKDIARGASEAKDDLDAIVKDNTSDF
jgi:hypothetical protein